MHAHHHPYWCLERGGEDRLHPQPLAPCSRTPTPETTPSPAPPACLPALLQSTVKEFFWPTKAWDSPGGPASPTLLASEENLGMEL